MVLDQSEKRPKRIVGSHRQLHWKHDKENRHFVKAEKAWTVEAGNYSDGVHTVEGVEPPSQKSKAFGSKGVMIVEGLFGAGEAPLQHAQANFRRNRINRRLSPEFRS